MYIQSNHGFCVPEVGVGVGEGDGVRGGDDGGGGGGVVNLNFRQHSPFSGKTRNLIPMHSGGALHPL